MADAAADSHLADEDALRAQWYSLLGHLLAGSPDQGGLDSLAGLSGDETEFGQAVGALAQAAAATTPDALAQEYFDLMVGVGKGELLPFGSYYQSGFLYEKPLARLRGDMRELGIARAEGVKEPEDHVAALMEMMSGLITGAFDAPTDLATQRRFFGAHLASWAPRFFEDLEAAEQADFYKSVGRIGRLFVIIEAEAFEMVA